MSRQPTPRPWDVIGPITKMSGGEPFFVVYAEDVQIVRLVVEANARFIVQACNSHDELVGAAKALLAACYDADIRYGLPEEVDGSYLDAMRNAIAKAEGRS